MKKRECIAFAGGGSGGHVFPGLAIIEELQENHFANIIWIGSRFGPEKKIVEKRTISFHAISSGKLRRYFSFKNFTDIFKIVLGFFHARKILKNNATTCLLALGGFVSVPAAYAAWSLGIPVQSVLLDISYSLSSKINTKISSTVFYSYEETLRLHASSAQKVHSAYPVRRQVRNADPMLCAEEFAIDKRSKVLFCMGGSLGADQINELVAVLLTKLSSNVIVFHQTGAKKYHVPEGLRARYIQADLFTENYASILSRSDLVLGRAGSGMIWDCVEQSVPMVLIPLSTKYSRGDQGENARYFSEHNMAINMGEDASVEAVVQRVQDLMLNTEALSLLRTACKNFKSKNNAAKIITSHIASF